MFTFETGGLRIAVVKKIASLVL